MRTLHKADSTVFEPKRFAFELHLLQTLTLF